MNGTITDRELQRRWITQRDADAFAELVSRYAGMVYAACYRVLGDAVEAEDAAQDCLIALSQEKRPAKSALGGWLHKVAVRRSLDRIRANQRRRRRDMVFAMTHSNNSDAEWDEVRPHLDEAIAALPEKLRVCVIQRFLEGRTHEAIAGECGISRSTAQYRIEQGVERIRRFLKGRGIISTAGALAALLSARAAEAAPASLIAAVGKRAVAGYVSGATQATLVGGIIMSKKVMLGVAALILAIALFAGYSVHRAGNLRSKETLLAEAAKTGPQDEARTEPTASAAGAQAANDNLTAQAQDSASGGPAAVPAVVEQGDSGLDAQSAEGVVETPSYKLSSPASISGTVLDGAAYPVAGATVRLEVMTAMGQVFDAFETSTDEQGSYLLSGVDVAGAMLASAIAPGLETHSKSLNPLTNGERRTGVDFVLTNGQNPIRGTVVNEEDEAISGARVTVINTGYKTPGQVNQTRSFDCLALAFSDTEGAFEVFCPQAGLTDLKVEKEGYPTKAFFGIASQTNDALLVLTKDTGAIAGTVTHPNGKPAVGYPVAVDSWVGAGGVERQSGATSKYFELQHNVAITNSRGDYRIDHLPAECFHDVTVLPTELASLIGDALTMPAQGGQDAQHLLMLAVAKGINVQSGKTTEVNLVLRSTTHIAGRVTNSFTGEPLPDIRVSAMAPLNDGIWADTQQDGRFELNIALSETTEIMLRARYIASFGSAPATGSDQTLSVSPGDEKHVEMSVVPPLELHVRAIDQNGANIPGLTIGVGEIMQNGSWNHSWPSMGTTDLEGPSVVKGLPPERTYFAWLVDAMHAQMPWSNQYFDSILARSAPVQAQPGEDLPEVVIVVEDKGGVEGYVTDAAGAPLGNAKVSVNAIAYDGAPRAGYSASDESGAFAILRALPPGRYPELSVVVTAKEGAYRAAVHDVEIVTDAVTNLGVVAVEPVPGEDAQSKAGTAS